jgi:murein DD-endopeptidase MepM/ murein hydrolase activator NlpD
MKHSRTVAFFNNNKKLIIISAIISFLVVLTASIFISYSIISKNMESQMLMQEIRLQEEMKKKQDALAQLENVISIRDSYRSNLKEIIELLYNRDTYLGIGGSNQEVPTSDEAILLQMQTVISGMNDDVQLMGQVKQYLQARSEFINSFPFIWPVKGGVPDISSNYGFRYDPFRRDENVRYHTGIDIPGELGDEIQVTAGGRVVAIWTENTSLGLHPDYGNLIIVEHEYGFRTYYGHLDTINVRWGQEVEKGDIVGGMGNSGRSTGIHLHYEVRHNNVPMDPMKYIIGNI